MKRSRTLHAALALSALAVSLLNGPGSGLANAQEVEATQDAAQAEPAPEPAVERQREIARDLFERGKARWLEGQYDAAAALLAASVEQLPVPSTLALLADSYEHLGRLESASNTFHRAAELATEKGNEALALSASTREAALALRIPQLEIRVAAPAPPDLSITLNGVELPAARFNAPLAMDAGYYQLEARAPGYLPWRSSVRLVNDRSPPGAQLAAVLLEPEARPVVASAPLPPARDTQGEQRREIAWWLGAGGAAALVTSGVVMLVSWAKYTDSRAACQAATGSAHQCPKAAFEERNSSLQLAGVATGVGLTGAALLGTGLTLYLTPVRAPEAAAPVGAGVGLGGAF